MSTQLKDKASVEQIIAEMTLEEKATLVTGGSPFKTQAMEKYGIPAVVMLDGATGFNSTQWALEQSFCAAAAHARASGAPLDRDGFGGMGGLLLGAKALIGALSKATPE